jgi:hypothetical protein
VFGINVGPPRDETGECMKADIAGDKIQSLLVHAALIRTFEKQKLRTIAY